MTSGVELLAHIREAFGTTDKLWTEQLLDRLAARAESPWREINYGKPLNDRGLAKRLTPYGIKSRDTKIDGVNRKGYAAADFHDAWKRYTATSATSATSATDMDSKSNLVAEIALVAATGAQGAEPCQACNGSGCPTC